jgi:hypothetical protein
MEHGIIETVRYEDGIVFCEIQAIRHTTTYNNVPILKSFGGEHKSPKPGQHVAMAKLDTGRRFIIGLITLDSSNEYPPDDDLRPEEMVFQVDDETIVELRKSEDGENYNINLQASGEINIDAPGTGPLNITTPGSGSLNIHGKDNIVDIDSGNNVFIDGIDFDEHFHEHDDDDGSTVSTKNTGFPKD